MDLQQTVSVKEISRTIHPSPWRADWCRRWDLNAAYWREEGKCDYGMAHRAALRMVTNDLLTELVKQIATCHESEINEVILAAKYAVGE